MRRALAYGAAAGMGYGMLQRLGRTAGSTRVERREAMPGDELVPRPHVVTDHAIDISAPCEQVWPWLTQMGWHLGGYYTPAWVDRWLFRANWTSLDSLDPALVRDLQVGDVIPDGPPGTAEYVVARVEPGTLVLRSTTHVPPGWERRGAGIDWTWCLGLAPTDVGAATRLHARIRGRMRPWWFRALYVAAIVPADFVMSRGMLHGLKRRVESRQPPCASGRRPFIG
jgi:hypothetical protein